MSSESEERRLRARRLFMEAEGALQIPGAESLLTFFGRSDLTAEAVDAVFPEEVRVGPSRAAAITSYLRGGGQIRTLADIESIPGIDKGIVDNMLKHAALGGIPDDPALLPADASGEKKQMVPALPPQAPAKPIKTVPRTPEDKKLEEAAEKAGCTQLLKVRFLPDVHRFNQVVLEDLEQYDTTLLGIIQGMALGLELFIRKTRLKIIAENQGLSKEFEELRGALRGPLGRAPNLEPLAPEKNKDFQVDGGKPKRDTIPGLKELDGGLRKLRELDPPKVAVKAKRPTLQQVGRVQVEFTKPMPQDVGRPVSLRLDELIRSRINSPLTNVARILRLQVDGTEIPSEIVFNKYDPRGPAFPCVANGRSQVPLPKSGVLTGTYVLFGNYGDAHLGAVFECKRGGLSDKHAEIQVSGLSEQQIRALEDLRNARVQDAMLIVTLQFTRFRNALIVVNAIIDSVSPLAGFLAFIPLIGQFLASFLEAHANFLENLLQSTEAFLESRQLGILLLWKVANDEVRERNLQIAELFPEQGTPGQPEAPNLKLPK